jgi:hypothetical protein
VKPRDLPNPSPQPRGEIQAETPIFVVQPVSASIDKVWSELAESDDVIVVTFFFELLNMRDN